ncbi:MAG TPA: hypothetical protein VGH84_17600 [Steroidobacteraceae bacterium]
MNRKLTDAQISAAFVALGSTGQSVSVRALRTALRQQYGATGKTARIYEVCRKLRLPPAPEPPPTGDLQRRLLLAEQGLSAAQLARDEAISRAERSEARELAHQDRWADEIHTLRAAVEQLKGERTRRQAVEDQVLRLQRELRAVRSSAAASSSARLKNGE